MDVFVVVFWFYDGDDNLIDAFNGVFGTHKEALLSISNKNKLEIVSSEDAEKRRNSSDGHFGTSSFFEVRTCVI